MFVGRLHCVNKSKMTTRPNNIKPRKMAASMIGVTCVVPYVSRRPLKMHFPVWIEEAKSQGQRPSWIASFLLEDFFSGFLFNFSYHISTLPRAFGLLVIKREVLVSMCVQPAARVYKPGDDRSNRMEVKDSYCCNIGSFCYLFKKKAW